MRTIYKYVIPHSDEGTVIDLPEGHKLLGVLPDPLGSYQPAIYVELESEDNDKPIKRKFRFIGTGQDMGVDTYIGSAITGSFCWHVLEVAL